jgi:hypothetical protein
VPLSSIACRAATETVPSGSTPSICNKNAAVVITKPHGTGSPARASSPNAAALPPARAASAVPTSAVQQVNGCVTR